MAAIEIAPAVPYSLERTVGAFARFPDESVDHAHPEGFRRLFRDSGGAALIQASQRTDEAFDTPVSLSTQAVVDHPDIDEFNQSIRRMLALDEPIDELYARMRPIARLHFLAQQLRGLRRTLDPTPFEGLVSSILAQLISIRGAAVARSRLVRAFGRQLTFDNAEYWTFPDAGAVQDATIDQLCSIGMTQTKARAIQTVAHLSATGELSLEQLQRATDNEVVRHLVGLPGIGPWTAEWFLVNVLGRMSIVPAGDLGIRRSSGNWLLDGSMPSPDDVRRVYEPFGDLRAYVAYYVLSAERHKLVPPVAR